MIDLLILKHGKGKYRPKPSTYRWQLSGARNQELFLLKILPYLRIKLNRGNMALNWLRERLVRERKFGRPFNKLMIQPELTSDCKSDILETV